MWLISQKKTLDFYQYPRSSTLSWTEKIRACRIQLLSEGADLYHASTSKNIYNSIQKANGTAI
jgi:hypothetical protein